MTETNCKRTKKVISGGNYYIAYSTESDSEFILVTIPRENDLANLRERVEVDEYCQWLTDNGFFGGVAIDMLTEKIMETRRK